MRTKAALTLVPIVALVALAGCSAAPKGDGRECIDVPSAIMSQIAEGANDFPIVPVAASAVRSKSFTDATIVAMSFTTPGDDKTHEGVWAVGGQLDSPGSILAVTTVAQTVTDWPGQFEGRKLDQTEDGVAEAKGCLANVG